MTETQEMESRNTDRATISLPPDLQAKAKDRARAQRRSFSAYIAVLIEQDLRKAEVDTGELVKK